MRKYLIRTLLFMLLAALLALSWWGWSSAGLSLLQLNSFIC